MLGYYPGNKDPELTRERIRQLLHFDVRWFVDLIQKGELTAYNRILAQEANAQGVDVVYKRFPIRKKFVPSSPLALAEALLAIYEGGTSGGRVYVHGSRDSTGRPSMVAACWLQDVGLDPKQAMQQLASIWQRTNNSERTFQLCTQEQLNWIGDWKPTRRKIMRENENKVVYDDFQKQLRSLIRQTNRLRREARRNDTIESSLWMISPTGSRPLGKGLSLLSIHGSTLRECRRLCLEQIHIVFLEQSYSGRRSRSLILYHIWTGLRPS
jgi:hypothetical protein